MYMILVLVSFLFSELSQQQHQQRQEQNKIYFTSYSQHIPYETHIAWLLYDDDSVWYVTQQRTILLYRTHLKQQIYHTECMYVSDESIIYLRIFCLSIADIVCHNCATLSYLASTSKQHKDETNKIQRQRHSNDTFDTPIFFFRLLALARSFVYVLWSVYRRVKRSQFLFLRYFITNIILKGGYFDALGDKIE